jgi:hypothetical protein
LETPNDWRIHILPKVNEIVARGALESDIREVVVRKTAGDDVVPTEVDTRHFAAGPPELAIRDRICRAFENARHGCEIGVFDKELLCGSEADYVALGLPQILER